MKWNYGIFLCFLLCASWQDLKNKAVEVRIYVFFGVLSAVLILCWYGLAEDWQAVGESLKGAAVGVALLAVSKISQNRMGAGDGWFFTVSGILLGFWENFVLLCSGVFCCGVFCLGYFVYGRYVSGKDVRESTVPFLPFLTAPGMWLVLQKLG